MKKSFLFSMALVAALSSCTKESEKIDYTEPSEFEINFGSKGDITAGVEQLNKFSRASIDKFDNTNVGVFVLAKNADADWQNEKLRDVLWTNVSATIAESGASTVDLNGQAKYYPNNGDREFSFFGYHPYSASNVNVTSSSVTKTFTITGQEDILWGKAETNGGYNAQYFRQPDAETPNIQFGHMLTKLQFKVAASENFNAENQEIKVTGIKVVNVPNEVTLTVADKTPDNAGTMTAGTEDKELTAYSDVNGITVTKGTAATPAGDPIMLYSNNKDQKYYVKLIITDPDGAQQETAPVEIKTTKTASFLRGSAYNITLNIKSFTEIVFTATVARWGDGEDISVEI